MTDELNTAIACPGCWHYNPATVSECEFCGESLIKAGMTLTCATIAPTLPAPPPDRSAPVNPPVPPAEPADDEEHASLAHFKISEVLGQGGMGAVYKAQDLALERFVALKMFRFAQDGTAGTNRALLDEARLACKLNHPNIVTIYDIARGEQSNFIVMEWVDGTPLKQLIPEHGLPLTQALEFAAQIADGLACAHRHGMIHRDIKPQNIMINRDQRVKILDFGIAALLGHPEQPVRNPSEPNPPEPNPPKPNAPGTKDAAVKPAEAIVGTPRYMSPKQAQGLALDQSSDLFSFGIVLYEMLSGKRPFDGGSLEILREKMQTANYIPLEKHCPDLPQPLLKLVTQLLIPERALRYASAQTLTTELREIQAELTQSTTWWQRQHWAMKTALVLPILALLAFGLRELIFPPSTTELIERQLTEATKIALLPLDNISGDPLLQLFTDGLVTTLTHDLALAGLEHGDGAAWIIPANEIRRLEDLSVKRVSDQFGVDVVITGSIQHMGSTRRVSLNLVNAKDGRLVKSHTLSIPAANLFEGQALVRKSVLGLLGWQISEALSAQLDQTQPGLDGAYKDYIEGLGFMYRLDQARNLKSAEAAFERALLQTPHYIPAIEALGELFFLNFTRSLDEEWLVKTQGVIDTLRQLNPENKKAWYLAGEIAAKRGEYQQAIDSYKRSLSTSDKDPDKAITLRSLANAYQLSGDSEAAENIYRLAVKYAPNNWRLIGSFGGFYFRSSNYKAALEQFIKVTQMSPNNDFGYKNVAAAYYALGDMENAIGYTRKAISINPSQVAWSNLGTILFYEQKYEEAIEAFLEATGLLNSDYINWGNLADAYKLTKNPNKKSAYTNAANQAQAALSLNQNDTAAQVHSAYYEANLGNIDKSLKLLEAVTANYSGQEHFIAALAYDALNLPDQVYRHLLLALENGYPTNEIIDTPLLSNFRIDPRFGILTEKNTK